MTAKPGKYVKAKHAKTPEYAEVVYQAAEAITKGQILYIAGYAGGFLKLGKADKDTGAKVRTKLFFALHDVPSASYGRAAEMGSIEGQTTAGSTIGDPVYLSTAGALTLTKPTSGLPLVIGTVGVVSATIGEVAFGGASVAVAPHAGPIVGVLKATAGAAATLTFSTTELGGNFDGKPVVATLNTVDATAVAIASAAWNGAGLLTVTFNAASTGIVRVSVLVASLGD